jgi:hypothetical protein
MQENAKTPARQMRRNGGADASSGSGDKRRACHGAAH